MQGTINKTIFCEKIVKRLAKIKKICIIKDANKNYGEMAERSKAAVLKTVDVKASWGSNPYLSAK